MVQGSLQVANLDRIVVGKNPHFIYLTSPLEKVSPTTYAPQESQLRLQQAGRQQDSQEGQLG